MIRAVLTQGNGRKMLILGIDDENVRRLTSGQPIHCKGETVGLEVDVVVWHEHSTGEIVESMRQHGFDVPAAVPADRVVYEKK
jgi:hypothetical protein